MKTVGLKGDILDPQSHLKWIQDKQRQIAKAQENHETRAEMAKEAKATVHTLVAELLQFIGDLNSGQERMNFGEAETGGGDE